MSGDVLKVIADALALKREEQELTAHTLIEHLSTEPPELEPELRETVQKRIDALRTGEAETVDHEDVQRDLLRKLEEPIS
ncbi:MAG: addiction module protein [Deltaproteobacteria bacterium]